MTNEEVIRELRALQRGENGHLGARTMEAIGIAIEAVEGRTGTPESPLWAALRRREERRG